MNEYISINELSKFLSKEIIDTLPHTDVIKLQHGKWEYDGRFWLCSECGAWEHFEEDLTIYCPYCGARMDKQ